MTITAIDLRKNVSPSLGSPGRPPALTILLTLVGLSLMSFASTGCGGPDSRSHKARVILTGSSTVAPVVSVIGRRFEARHPHVRIEVQTGGSSRGIADARSGAASLGMISRQLAPDELDLTAFTIARDGIGMIVHADNPVPVLTDDQVAAIYRGETRRWSEVGGPNTEITVVNKAEGRATLEVFKQHFGLESPEIRADVVIGHNEQGVKTVAGNPNAIGYVSIGVAEADIRQGIPIRLVPIGGVEPSTRTVADGTFPISRPLNLVANGEPQGPAAELIDFCLSEEVHDLIEAQGFVPSRR